MTALLENISAESPGRYLTEEEYKQLLADSPYLEGRILAARDAQAKEEEVVGKTVRQVLKKYDFRKAYEFGEDKCIRDVAVVYRYAVYCMLCDDRQQYEDKLLLWMRTIIQSFGFPGGLDSIRMTYKLLREEARKRVKPETAELLDPFLAVAEEILPAESID